VKPLRQSFYWALFLLLSGAFLLLKDLGEYRAWGDVAWGALFAAAGLAFLIWFALGPQHWWRAVPAFILISIGAPVLLAWQHISLGNWNGSVLLFGIALAFWVILLARRDNWWAEIPAGVLTVLAVLLGLEGMMRADFVLWPPQWLAALYVGLGLVFGLLYVLRLGERETWWPAVPAAALILFGAVTFIGSLALPPLVALYWPAILLLAGLVVLVVSFRRLWAGASAAFEASSAAVPDKAAGNRLPVPAQVAGALLPAKGMEVPESPPIEQAPAPDLPAPGAPATAPVAGDVDIYAYLKGQPAPNAGDEGK
jgi:hypothetical protein